jgi:hypothetical protein
LIGNDGHKCSKMRSRAEEMTIRREWDKEERQQQEEGTAQEKRREE